MDDLKVAKRYLLKSKHAKDRGIEFTLSFVSFKNMMNAEYCAYTGLSLSPETRTIDRIDNLKGYVKGNVVACHHAFNQLKSVWENPLNVMDDECVAKAMRNVMKRKMEVL